MSKPIAFRHTASRCPNCRQILNGTVDPQDRGAPRAGDLSVCVGCGTILCFGPNLTLTAITPEQLGRLPSATAKELLDAKRRFELSKPRRQAALRVVR